MLAWCLSSAALIAWGRKLLGRRFFRWLDGLCGLALGYLGMKILWRALGAVRFVRVLPG